MIILSTVKREPESEIVRYAKRQVGSFAADQGGLMPASDHDIFSCSSSDTSAILAIINEAALAYRGVIPDDRWHDPYMRIDELQRDIERGVSFVGTKVDGTLVGVMGVQRVRDRGLIRHAYVLPSLQGHGIGGSLLRHLMAASSRPMLVGTWASATWAVAFYQRHGFTLADPTPSKLLLGTYWDIPPAQAEASVVLLGPTPNGSA